MPRVWFLPVIIKREYNGGLHAVGWGQDTWAMVIPEQLLGCQWELKTLGNNKNNLVRSETHQNASGLLKFLYKKQSRSKWKPGKNVDPMKSYTWNECIMFYVANVQIKIRVQRTLFAMSVKLQVSQFNGLASTKILQN